MASCLILGTLLGILFTTEAKAPLDAPLNAFFYKIINHALVVNRSRILPRSFPFMPPLPPSQSRNNNLIFIMVRTSNRRGIQYRIVNNRNSSVVVEIVIVAVEREGCKDRMLYWYNSHLVIYQKQKSISTR